MKKILFICSVLMFTYSASAAVRVYNAETGEKTGVKTLVNSGAVIPEMGELTEDQLKKMTKADFFKYINQPPDSHKPIEKQKLTGLGTVMYFTSLDSLGKKQAKVMTRVSKLEGVRLEFFIKELKSNTARVLIAAKTGGELDVFLKTDSNNKVARRLHVDSYPQIIYIAPDGSRARYSGSSGGLTALKIKLGEIKALLELQEKAKQVESEF